MTEKEMDHFVFYHSEVVKWSREEEESKEKYLCSGTDKVWDKGEDPRKEWSWSRGRIQATQLKPSRSDVVDK